MKLKDILNEFISTQTSFWSDLKVRQYIHSLDRNFNDLYDEVRENAAPVFVLSTGRCGTLLLTELLSISKDLAPVHEPFPELSFHSALAFKEPQTNFGLKLAIDAARYEVIRNSYLIGKRYVETNNRVTFFAWYLTELYPKAKFIHLVRNPTCFIKSGVVRDWYSGKTLYDEGRIRNDQLFEVFNQQQKIAWLWAQTNQFAEDFRQAHPERCFLLQSEDLFEGNHKVGEAFEFLGLASPSLRVLKSKTNVLLNKSNYNKPKSISIEVRDIPFLEMLLSKYSYPEI